MHKALITRRRDQATFKGNPIAADQVIGGVLFLDSEEARRRWIERLSQKHSRRFNYFVGFRDVHGSHSLSFGHADYVRPGTISYQ